MKNSFQCFCKKHKTSLFFFWTKKIYSVIEWKQKKKNQVVDDDENEMNELVLKNEFSIALGCKLNSNFST